jgi:hypothetical protein
MGKMPDHWIESLTREALEARLREAVLAMQEGGAFDDIELEHLIRVVTRCSVLLGDIYTPDRVRTILEGDQRRVASLLELPTLDLAAGEGRLRWLPDDVQVVGDQCLFDLGVSGLERIHGVLLTDLGPRAYRLASELLGLLGEDAVLRDHFLGNRLGRILPIEEEVIFLRRCADKFPVYAELLRQLAVVGDRGGLEVGAPPVAAAPPAHLALTADRPPEALTPPAAPLQVLEDIRLEDHLSDRDQLLAAYERILLFSTLETDSLRQALKWRVVDQDEAVDTLCDEFALYAAGTHTVGKPASYFFVGPTGVGKNLLAETLVSLLESLWGIEVPLLTLEGPNYTYPSDINELRGATRGFIRSDEKGLLTEYYERAGDSPCAVILVDEVEKAHPQLRKFFLSIMDRGTTTDAHGRTLRFGNVILFYTSNIGYRLESAGARPIGFGGEEEAADTYQAELTRALKRTLTPEFINRVRMVRFRHLTRTSIEKIFDLEFEKIASRFRDLHQLELVATPAAKEALIHRGYSQEYGARYLSGVLHDLCNVAVSKMIRADEQRDDAQTRETLSYVREVRQGERPFDPEKVRARVRRAARAEVPYHRVVVDAEGERIIYRPERPR